MKFLALFSLLVLSPFQSPLWKPSLSDRIEPIVENFLVSENISGSVLCATNGVVAFEKSRGIASYEWNKTNIVQTRYYIASLGKSFTAYIIVKLKEQGYIRLSDFAVKYIPELFHSPFRKVTIYQLLTHTSGIPDLFRVVKDSDLSQPIDRKAYLERLIRQKPVGYPGEMHYYSNMGYALLGWIAESASGISFKDLFQKWILTPLQLSNTGVLEYNNPIKGLASGYLHNRAGQILYPSPVDVSQLFSAGNVYSSVEDLNRWVNYLKSLKNTPPYDQIWHPWVRAWFPGLTRLSYGYAWRIQKLVNSTETQTNFVIFHTGKLGGNNGIICYYPAFDMTLIFLGNHYRSEWKEFPGLTLKKQIERVIFSEVLY